MLKANEISAEERTNIFKKRSFFYYMKRDRSAYILMLPAIILVTLLCYLPMGGIIMGFKEYSLSKGIFGSPWVGIDNFKTVFTQPSMLKAIWNSLVYGVVLTFVGFPFPVLLALLFNELTNLRFKKIVQTISYMPYFLSWITVVGLFYSFLDTGGSFNYILSKIIGEGYQAQNILMDSKYFLGIIFVSNIWKTIGWSSVIFLAAISGIDMSLYEAATVDGCGKMGQLWHITLPGIRATAVIILVMSLGGLFNTNFEQVFGFQNVYTQDSTEVINTLIYRTGIQNGKYSLATAFGLSQGIVTIALLLFANTICKKLFEISIW